MARELDGFLFHTAGRQRLIDVGACHGLFALAFAVAARGRTALALEPSPLAAGILAANLSLNPEAKVHLVRLAAGDRMGQVTMRPVWHHLEASGATPDSVSVQLVTLDALSDELEFEADVLKIDVEGYELHVLRGAEATLARHPLIFLEVHPARLTDLGGSSQELLEMLSDHDYQLFDAGPHGGLVSARAFRAGRRTARYRCAPRGR